MHVGDLDARDRAQGRAQAQRSARVVRVHVDLECRLVAHDEQRVAERLKLALERDGIEPRPVHEECRAVPKLRKLAVDGLQAQLGHHGGKRELVSGDRRDDSARDLDEPRAAGIDDARLP